MDNNRKHLIKNKVKINSNIASTMYSSRFFNPDICIKEPSTSRNIFISNWKLLYKICITKHYNIFFKSTLKVDVTPLGSNWFVFVETSDTQTNSAPVLNQYPSLALFGPGVS